MPSKGKATATTDHDEIRRWAEDRGAKPACVRNTGDRNDVGIIRLDFPGYSGEQSLEPIEWDMWFEKFDEQGLALLHQKTLANGRKSNFNKLVSRETVKANEDGAAQKQRAGKPQAAKSHVAGSKSSHAGTKTAASGRKAETKQGDAKRHTKESPSRKAA